MWCADAFSEVVTTHGYCCDTCENVTVAKEDKVRIIAERCLANLDGRVKLLLCVTCKGRYMGFCNRVFGDDGGSPYNPDTEKKMLAYIAWRITVEYDRYMERTRADAAYG